MTIQRFYKSPGLLSGQLANKHQAVTKVSSLVDSLKTELCYYVESTQPLTGDQVQRLTWLLSPPFQLKNLGTSSFGDIADHDVIIEIAPR